MKTVILVGDGMGDYPIDELGGKTPLQVARIPFIHLLAGAGHTILVRTVPPGMTPGSDVANLSLLGYDPATNYTGRAPIEAAGADIAMSKDDVAYRCNLVTIENGIMADYSADHITTEEGRLLIESLGKKLDRDGVRFYPGISYRHLLIWRGGPEEITTQPPHDIALKPIEKYLPKGARANEIAAMMTTSQEIFQAHPINKARRKAGKKPATQIWIWGQGKALQLETYQKRYGLTGGVISAVDLVRGIGKLAGLEAPVVPGATGFIDTNFAGKVNAAIEILGRGDFVYLHLEAPDECGHGGNLGLKIAAIEAFDKQVVGPIWEHLEKMGEPYRLVIATDHRTPVSVRGHTDEPVPMVVVDGPTGERRSKNRFDEMIGGEVKELAFEFIDKLLRRGATKE